MRLLLDTQILIWTMTAPDRLPSGVVTRLLDDRDTKIFSAVSTWEVAIKFSAKRPDFDVDPRDFIDQARASGFIELAITSMAAARVADLPFHHRDPFDRLLVAQALAENAILLTADRALTTVHPSCSPAEPHL